MGLSEHLTCTSKGREGSVVEEWCEVMMEEVGRQKGVPNEKRGVGSGCQDDATTGVLDHALYTGVDRDPVPKCKVSSIVCLISECQVM